VVRTSRYEDGPICRLRFSAKRDGQWVAQEVLVTPDHPIHVTGYHNDGGFSDEYFDELDKPIGWRQADSLESHQLVLLASGETMGAPPPAAHLADAPARGGVDRDQPGQPGRIPCPGRRRARDRRRADG
jgi:hypothetical protein